MPLRQKDLVTLGFKSIIPIVFNLFATPASRRDKPTAGKSVRGEDRPGQVGESFDQGVGGGHVGKNGHGVHTSYWVAENCR